MRVDSMTALLTFRTMDTNKDGLVSKTEMESKLFVSNTLCALSDNVILHNITKTSKNFKLL